MALCSGDGIDRGFFARAWNTFCEDVFVTEFTYTVRIPHDLIEATDKAITAHMETFSGSTVDDALDAIFAQGVAVKVSQARATPRLFLEIEP